jgi:hypothetical protein
LPARLDEPEPGVDASGDLGEESGRAALRITLLHLRHLLFEGADVSPVPHLLIQRDTLGLDFTSALDLDLYILLEACTSTRASTHTSLTIPEEAHGEAAGQV